MSVKQGADEIEIVCGRTAPYSQLPDWIAISGVDANAMAIYWILKMHVNRARGDHRARPTRPTLAELLRVKQARTVDGPLAALVKIGAIDIERTRIKGGLQARNIYTVHEEPPPGYTGPRSLADWYAAKKPTEETPPTDESPEASESDTKTPKEPVSAADQSPEKDSKPPVDNSPEVPEMPGSSAVRSGALRGAFQRTSVVRSNALEPDAFKEVLPPPTSSTDSEPENPSVADNATDEEKRGGGEKEKEEKRQKALEILDPLLIGHKRPAAKLKNRLIVGISQALELGWSPKTLREVLLDNLGSAQYPPAVWDARLADLGAPPAPPKDERPECPIHHEKYVVLEHDDADITYTGCPSCPPPPLNRQEPQPETEDERRARWERLQSMGITVKPSWIREQDNHKKQAEMVVEDSLISDSGLSIENSLVAV